MVISVRTQLKYHDSHKGRVDVFSQLQRLPMDALTEPSLERLLYVFDWEARCLSIEKQYTEEGIEVNPDDDGPLTIPFEDAFLPGREQELLAIRQVAHQLSQLGSEPLNDVTI